MFVAIREGVAVRAIKANKAEGGYVCPQCENSVILKYGAVNAPHFAHKSSGEQDLCPYSRHESEEHAKVKRQIYEEMLFDPRVSRCKMERNLKTVRPDVSARIHSYPVAIEVQRSSISIEDIVRRMKTYNGLGIYVVWVLTREPAIVGKGIFHLDEWQKFLQAMCFGRLFVWHSCATVALYSMTRIKNARRHTWRSFSRDGLANIVDMNASRREGWSGRSWDIPNCRLWMT